MPLSNEFREPKQAVIFTHPLMARPLTISVNPDQIVWSYGLNTKSYPTYGGEVVQILSVYFGDMTLSGTVPTVAEAERIYSWFILYMQYATQGRDQPSYDQHPVAMSYPARGWHFQLWPKSLPGFKLSREVVAPTWKLTAAVKEPDATFANQIKDFSTWQAQAGKLETFGKATADFGNTGDLTSNPFGSPDASPKGNKQTLNQYLSGIVNQYADSYNGFVQAWQNSDWSHLPQFNGSGPAKPKSPSATGNKQKGAPKVTTPSTPSAPKSGQAPPTGQTSTQKQWNAQFNAGFQQGYTDAVNGGVSLSARQPLSDAYAAGYRKGFAAGLAKAEGK